VRTTEHTLNRQRPLSSGARIALLADATYTVVRSGKGWLVDSVKATPLDPVK